jgi:hypothetical protein
MKELIRERARRALPFQSIKTKNQKTKTKNRKMKEKVMKEAYEVPRIAIRGIVLESVMDTVNSYTIVIDSGAVMYTEYEEVESPRDVSFTF